MKKGKVKEDLCEEIKEGDIVELLPEYMYWVGSSIRIKEYFNVREGEVVIKKTIKVNDNGEKVDNLVIRKCNRNQICKINV